MARSDCSDLLRRKWLHKVGKNKVINFTRSQLSSLRACFDQLDDDGGGTIGLEELMIPLIGLGLCHSVQEVIDIFEMVDEDCSGEIEFDEFLEITANKYGKCKNRDI